ncbi:DoxX family protein [Defluviicoccus vanus]|uniref:DoxX family protein n=1 Tax=Defluviicoccus vanus TaxID=111831 RepID=A0A7H1N1A3_9PROT|nr:DoxX family protein [Defluviicoccus vanus]QNT69489.1 DoxX family protein [Defluviicoccus vanus]
MGMIDRWLPGLARFCLILLFPFSALDKIFDYSSAVAQANASGMPMPGWLLLLLGGCLEVFGSLGILFDVYRRQFALLFCFYCIVTGVLFHNFWDYPFRSADWMDNFWPFLKNFGLVGGFLFIATNARMQPIAGAISLRRR